MKRAFTLIELLVTITIIGILAAMAGGALHSAREYSKEAATKATIAKLNAIIMERYESYLTRRVDVPIPSGLTPAQLAAWNMPANAARRRLDAIRDLMRMEMPDAKTDVTNGPIAFAWGSISEPALHRIYAADPPTGDHDGAQCLYKSVSIGSPDAMEQFNQSELGTVDSKPCFIDGWGTPIMFLRWAPGFASPIQTGDVTNDHDPFDSRNVDATAFRLVPLIYSAGPDAVYDLNAVAGYVFAGDPYAEMRLGQPMDGNRHHDNITNHSIEQR